MKYWSSELEELVDVTLTSENTNISDSHRIKSVKGMKDLLLDVRGQRFLSDVCNPSKVCGGHGNRVEGP